MNLDQSLKTQEERIQYISNLISKSETSYTSSELSHMSDYIFDALPSKLASKIGVITKNRLKTIKARETSYEGLISSLEQGEDAFYNLIEDNKQARLTQKKKITPHDIETIPGLADLQAAIEELQCLYKSGATTHRYLLKQHIISMQQLQYIIKSQYQINGCRVHTSNYVRGIAYTPLDEHIHLDDSGEPVSDGIISLFNPKHIAAILNNYSSLKQYTETLFNSDLYYLLLDFDAAAAEALKPYPMYEAIVTQRVDGKNNNDISALLLEEFGKTYTPQYISNLYNNKIPKTIAETAKRRYIDWYYLNVEYGHYKKCSRCGQIKLIHPQFFSKNKASKDGFYSICKECRRRSS